jgi:hypothetical protein
MTRELHNLSSVCQQTEQELRCHEEEAKNVLQQWQESGQLPSPEILARLITTRDEVMSRSIERYRKVVDLYSCFTQIHCYLYLKSFPSLQFA